MMPSPSSSKEPHFCWVLALPGMVEVCADALSTAKVRRNATKPMANEKDSKRFMTTPLVIVTISIEVRSMLLVLSSSMIVPDKNDAKSWKLEVEKSF
jgi:hypothetical protein